MKNQILITGLMLLCGTITLVQPKNASAASAIGVLAEPYIGYGILGATTVGNTNFGSYNGAVFGARAGVELLDFLFVALDGSYAPSLFLKLTSAGEGLNVSPSQPAMTGGASNFKLGLTAGVKIPLIGLRAWLGYNILDQLQGTSSTTLNGYSFKAGVGIPVLMVFNVNLEYFFSSTYSTFSPQNGASTNNPAGSILNSHVLASVSVPLTF